MRLSRRAFCLCTLCGVASPLTALAAPVTNGGNLLEPSLHVAKGGATPQVALTFDACSGETDHRILDLLVSENIPATIFVTGRWLRRNGPAIAILKSRPDLFEIENHGLNHVPAVDYPDTIYGIPAAGSPDAVASEVKNGVVWMEKSGFSRPLWFRGATARYTPSAITAIEAMGYRIAGYSLNGDQGASASAPVAAKRIAGARDGDVVISHINHPERPAGKGVADGILALRKKGFTFVRLDAAALPASTPASPAINR